MRMIAAYRKEGGISYTSHLDVQRILHRAMRRADLPLMYSQGFNPHPITAFCTALATGYTGECEWFECGLTQEMEPEEFTRRMNAALPNGMSVWGSFVAEEGMSSLAKLVRAARYLITLTTKEPLQEGELETAVEKMLTATEITVDKKSKGGMRTVDMRPQILEAKVIKAGGCTARIDVLGTLFADGGLRADAFMHVLLDLLGTDGFVEVHRSEMLFEGCAKLPRFEASSAATVPQN